MSFNFYLLFYNIFNKDSMMIYDQDCVLACTRQDPSSLSCTDSMPDLSLCLVQQKKKKHIILPNELIIMIYKYADNNTKFHLIKIFYWLKNIYLQCYNIHCQNKAKYIIHFKVLSEKCNCNINKKDLFFTNIVCSLNCNNCILLNYHYTNQSKYLQKQHFPLEFSSNYPLKFHTYTRFNKSLGSRSRHCSGLESVKEKEPGCPRLCSGQECLYRYNCMDSCYNKKCIICLHNFYNEKINMYGIKLLN